MTGGSVCCLIAFSKCEHGVLMLQDLWHGVGVGVGAGEWEWCSGM